MLLGIAFIAETILGIVVGFTNWDIFACRVLAIISAITLLITTYEMGKRMEK